MKDSGLAFCLGCINLKAFQLMDLSAILLSRVPDVPGEIWCLREGCLLSLDFFLCVQNLKWGAH